MAGTHSRRPSGFWQKEITDALRNLRGTVSLGDIYKWLENHGNLTEEELSASPYGGRPWFQHSIRSTCSNMARTGKIQHIGSGLYRLP
jgi:hypothetical protein